MQIEKQMKALVSECERGVNLYAGDLLEEFQDFMKEYYIADFEQAEGSFRAIFKNGQIFKMTVEEME